MTVQEAYEIVKKENPGMVAIVCLEFTEFYAFGLTEKGRENEPIGGGFITVNKSTGETGGFSPTEDFDAFFAAKDIPIDTLK
jgi:hypothetical protein